MDSTLKKYIINKCQELKTSNDYLYYIIEEKNNHQKCVVCCAWNVILPNNVNQIGGVNIYTTKSNLTKEQIDKFGFSKNILGEEYVKVCSMIDNGKYYNLTFQENKKNKFINRLDTDPKFNSIYNDSFTFYDYDNVIDIIEPRKSASILYKKNAKIKKVLDYIMEEYNIPLKKIGIIGSVSLGAKDTHDFDLILYGDEEQSKQYKKILDKNIKKYGKYKAGDFYIPFIYKYGNEVIDMIFVYDFEIPLTYSTPRLLKKHIEFEVEITSDKWSYSQFPIYIVKSDKIKFDFLLLGLLNSIFRMAIKNGDKVSGYADLIEYECDGRTEQMLLCVNPKEQVNNYKQYFKK